MLSALTGREVQKLLFNQRRREKTLPQTAVPTPKGPSWSGTHAAELLWPQVAPSHLLWDILTEEGLTVSNPGRYRVKGDPSYIRVHAI